MITLRVLNEYPLLDIQEAIATTLGKQSLKSVPDSKDALVDYYITLFIQNHSVVRSVHFRIIDTEANKSVTRQLLRATTGGPQPYVESSRPDWTGKPRNEEETCFFTHDHTAESFIMEARQRLCYRAWAPTRKTVLDIVRKMWESGDPFFEALAVCCVPNCVFQYGCPEGKFNCGWWDKQEDYPYNLVDRRMHYLMNEIVKEDSND